VLHSREKNMIKLNRHEKSRMKMAARHNFVAAAAVVLGSVGAVSGIGTAAAVPGACGLITQQEAATAFGAPVPAGAETAMDLPVADGPRIRMQSCLFGSGVVVARYELGSGAPALFGKYRQEYASHAGASDYQNVTGIGDEAFSAKGQLMIRKGQTGLLVGVSGGDGQNVRVAAKHLQAEKALAAAALNRLQ
jgi:hypothetical protein